MRRTLLAIAVIGIVTFSGNAVAAAPLTVAAGSDRVAIMRHNGDGTISVRMGRLGSGMRADSFKAPLGWTKVDTAPTTGATSALAAVCRYGDTPGLGDNSLIWPCIRWGWAGYSDPQVYFRDHTPGEWPVTTVVADWNQTVGIDSYYIWKSTPCPAVSTGKHCVNVIAWWSSEPFAAWVDYSYDDRSNRFIDGTVQVNFNTRYYHGGVNEHRKTVCEELGHALGVGHNQDDNEGSCMNQNTGTVPLSDTRPGSNDRGLLTHVVYVD